MYYHLNRVEVDVKYEKINSFCWEFTEQKLMLPDQKIEARQKTVNQDHGKCFRSYFAKFSFRIRDFH